ncbi:hypothetical protein DPMN_096391 [Dreissena polymorpha]|uniref:Uncharacterized protein n=1 Tax=Dreissena polymorpha TaxID=45954 RepID=A0A9D4LB96_DREPO|nr:hypothetical protein DPMN_096391 [Dreissena polymorpha]
MPGPLLTFLSALFKTPKYKPFQSIAHDIEELLQHLEDEVHEESFTNTGRSSATRTNRNLVERPYEYTATLPIPDACVHRSKWIDANTIAYDAWSRNL